MFSRGVRLFVLIPTTTITTMSTDVGGCASSPTYETPRQIPCDIWIGGFVIKIDHLYLLCGAHRDGLTKEDIERQEPLTRNTSRGADCRGSRCRGRFTSTVRTLSVVVAGWGISILR